MGEAKIEIKLGEISFSGEGDSTWLSEQLDKIMDRAEELMALAPAQAASLVAKGNGSHEEADLSDHSEIASQPLALWLKSKNADTVQTAKFLATAIWLEAKGQRRLQTKDVTSALSNANQRRLSNASDCLSSNIKKGFCEKEGSQFYVTEEGKRSLGIS